LKNMVVGKESCWQKVEEEYEHSGKKCSKPKQDWMIY
jgi:hypothetical protein